MHSLLSGLFFQSWHHPPGFGDTHELFQTLDKTSGASCALLWASAHRSWRTNVCRPSSCPPIILLPSPCSQELSSPPHLGTSVLSPSRDAQVLLPGAQGLEMHTLFHITYTASCFLPLIQLFLKREKSLGSTCVRSSVSYPRLWNSPTTTWISRNKGQICH